MENEQPTFVEQLLDLIYQLISPEWVELISLLPLVFIGLIVLYFAFAAYQWRRASERNRPRVARPLAAGEPPPGIHLPGPSRWPFVLPIGGALILLALALPPRDEAGQVVLPFNLPLFGLGLLITLASLAGWLLDAMREWRTTAHTSEAVAGGALAPGTRPIATLPAVAGEARREAPREPPPGVHMPGPSPWPFFAPIGIAMILFGLILSWALVVGGLVLAILAAAGWYREAAHEYRTTEQLGHPVPRTRDPEHAWPRRLVPVFVAVFVLSVLVALAPLGLAWLRGLGPPPPGEETPPPVPAVPEITARNAMSFETNLLAVPCCRDFQLTFHNEDDGIPHDVMIADGSQRSEVFFDGEIITGVDEITYEVPALDEGDYYFLCTVHPNMNGTVQARPEGPGGAPGDGAPGDGAPAEATPGP